MGPQPPTRFLMQRCSADKVAPSSGGDTSRTRTAAGARHVSLRAKPISKAAKDCWYSGASRLRAIKGDAAMLAPDAATARHVVSSYTNLCKGARATMSLHISVSDVHSHGDTESTL